MYLWPGLHPTTHWTVYSTLPDPLTGFKRATLQQGVEGRGVHVGEGRVECSPST